MSLTVEVVGYKGVVGNATYQWFKAMHPELEVIGRDKGDAIECKDMAKIVSFICTPETIVEEVCSEVAQYAELMVIRSTVKPLTCQKIQKETGIHTCHNPEFLREATAVMDKFNQEFMVVGACCEEHAETLVKLYEVALTPIVVTDTVTSEFTKLAINNYLATIITFWNEIEQLAQGVGTTGHKVGAIASLDSRISSYGARYHQPFGGRCLPKDLKQTIQFGESIGINATLLNKVEEINECLKLSLLSQRTMRKEQ